MKKLILIIGESDLVRLGFTAVFADRDVSIVTADHLNDGVRYIIARGPDLIVYDPFSNDTDGRAYLLKLRQRFPHIPVLVMTDCCSPIDIQYALQQQVSGYILRNASTSDLVAAIETILYGRTYFHPEVTHVLLNTRNGTPSTTGRLTARQEEVLTLIAEGRTAKQIAAALGVSQKTVESHRVALMTRLGIHNIVGLMRYAILNGYAKLEEETSPARLKKTVNL